MEGAATESTVKPVIIMVEGNGSVYITFHRLGVLQFVASDSTHSPPHLPSVIVLQLCFHLFL